MFVDGAGRCAGSRPVTCRWLPGRLRPDRGPGAVRPVLLSGRVPDAVRRQMPAQACHQGAAVPIVAAAATRLARWAASPPLAALPVVACRRHAWSAGRDRQGPEAETVAAGPDGRRCPG